MKKTVFFINIIFFVLISVGNYIFTGHGGVGPLSATAVKGITSGLFALLGLINLFYMSKCKIRRMSFAYAMCAGLIFSMLGDIVLGYDFVIGAGLFALGHVLYFASYCILKKPRWQDFFFSGVIFVSAALFVLLCPLLTFDPPVFRWVCVGYALIISLMTGKAISSFAHGMSTLTAIIMIGSTMFFFSDFMLVFDWFIGRWDITGYLCMATYYPAQWLLAFSIFAATRKKYD